MYGRGGAGNINAAKESSKRVAEDVEAAHNTAPPTSSPPPPQPSNASQEYAHMGRGGAGNWYQPSELKKDGVFSAPGDATSQPTSYKPQISTPWHPEGQEMPVAKGGRGGAGNFVWKSEEAKKKDVEIELQQRERVREGVERDVEAGLAKPPGVVFSQDKEGRGW